LCTLVLYLVCGLNPSASKPHDSISMTNFVGRAPGRCAALRFFTCGEPVELDGGAEAAPPPFSFEAEMAAAKAQVSRHKLT
jgi:hypothetical protein